MNKRILLVIILLLITFTPISAFSFWMWTPETNKWVNPKYAVKETPKEQLEYALEFYSSKDYKKAIKELNKLIKHYPRARQAPKAQYYIGMCLEEQGQLFEAFKSYQIVIDKYPFSDLSEEIIKKQYAIGLEILEGQNKRSNFLSTISPDNYDVIEVFKTVIKNAPYGELAPSSQYKIGLYLLEKGLFQESRDAFEKVINDYPDSEWAKAAQYKIAIADAKRSTDAQYDQEITKSAVGELKEFIEVYPDAELSTEAKSHIRDLREKEAENNFVIAQYYEKQKNYDSAKIYYELIVDKYKDSRWASKALKKIREISQRTE